MRVHLIRRESVELFTIINAQSRGAFEEWLEKIRYADWSMSADIQGTFPSADLLGKSSSRVVFDIGGNKYRMIAKYAFGIKQIHLFICWIGTHADYTKLCRLHEQYTIHIY
jgi:mRNA interferase HigB